MENELTPNSITPPITPLIVGFVADLMFTPRIENAARGLGYRVQWVATATDIAPVDPHAAPESPGERLHGQTGELFARLTAWQPALLLFDLNNSAIPWAQWIAALKSSPATRRLPILCFGSHADTATMTLARQVGADAVLARSRFTADLPGALQQYARIPDHAALADSCAQSLPKLAQQGIALFNLGEYYKCHDDLEEAWRQDEMPGRELYQGILQVGIALYQVQRNNYRGAVKMLLRVRQWLEPLPDVCRGVNVARLRQNVDAYYDAITALGADNLAQFDWSLVEPVEVA
jgi:predicted metal-dependent hydrolase